MVVYPDGSTGRVDLTLALDIATRTLCSAILRPVATKSVDAAMLLARALTPLPMQPGWHASLSFSRSVLPAGMIRGDDEVRASIAAKPVIVPESITIDRGKVFVGSTFLNACERLQISVTKAAPRTPTDKPHVERVFAAINSGFTQYLAGYVGPNVVHRGTSPHEEAVWTLAEVQNLLDLWIVAVWQNKPHPGLRHPAMPKKDLSPNETYAALASVAPTVNVALDRDDYIGLLPVTYRSIQGYGINFEGLHYDSAELHPYRGVKSGLPLPAADRWEVRYDPYRLQSIFVRDHTRGVWIEAEWSLAKTGFGPVLPGRPAGGPPRRAAPRRHRCRRRCARRDQPHPNRPREDNQGEKGRQTRQRQHARGTAVNRRRRARDASQHPRTDPRAEFLPAPGRPTHRR